MISKKKFKIRSLFSEPLSNRKTSWFPPRIPDLNFYLNHNPLLFFTITGVFSNLFSFPSLGLCSKGINITYT